MNTTAISSQPASPKTHAGHGSCGLVCNGSATCRMGTTHAVSPVFSSSAGLVPNRSRSLVAGR